MAKFPSDDRENNSGSGGAPSMDADTVSGRPARTSDVPSMGNDTLHGLSSRRVLASAAGDDWDGSDTDSELEAVSGDEKARMLSALRGTNPNREKVEQLSAENKNLRAIVADLRKQVDEAVGQTQGAFAKREEEFEAQLEEKSEELRTLFIRIQEAERGQADAAAQHAASPAGRQDEERSAMWEDIQRDHQALEEERQKLQEERRQLREDEESMFQRMREMELQVSKSRTEMVRQRNELQQLHNDVRAELERAQQNGTSLERLRSLRQKHQEVSSRRR